MGKDNEKQRLIDELLFQEVKFRQSDVSTRFATLYAKSIAISALAIALIALLGADAVITFVEVPILCILIGSLLLSLKSLFAKAKTNVDRIEYLREQMGKKSIEKVTSSLVKLLNNRLEAEYLALNTANDNLLAAMWTFLFGFVCFTLYFIFRGLGIVY